MSRAELVALCDKSDAQGVPVAFVRWKGRVRSNQRRRQIAPGVVGDAIGVTAGGTVLKVQVADLRRYLERHPEGKP